jgi:hypothetical protein
VLRDSQREEAAGRRERRANAAEERRLAAANRRRAADGARRAQAAAEAADADAEQPVPRGQGGARKVKFCRRVVEDGRDVKRWYYGTIASIDAPRLVRFRDDAGALVERVLGAQETVGAIAPALFAAPPAARDRDVMTRRDRDGMRGPATAADVTRALATVDQLARGDGRDWDLCNLLTSTPRQLNYEVNVPGKGG